MEEHQQPPGLPGRHSRCPSGSLLPTCSSFNNSSRTCGGLLSLRHHPACSMVPAGRSHIPLPSRVGSEPTVRMIPALQESTVAQLQDILQAAENLPNPYESLKAKLIRQYTSNMLEKLNRIVYVLELGRQPPF